MIITKTVKIRTKSNKNTKIFKSKGYDVDVNYIDVKVEDLPNGSHEKIHVKCEICGNEKEIMYQKYIKNIKNGGFYACSSKCAQKKVKNTSKEKFGTEYYMQTKEYKERYENTCIEKYGVCHHTQNEDIKNKGKVTTKERYGFEYYTQTEEYKEKYKNTCLEKYGVENVFQNEDTKDKIKETNLEKYGVEHIMYLDKYKKMLIDNSKKYKEKYILEKYKDIKINDIDYETGLYNITCEKCGNDFDIHRLLFKNRMRSNTEICLLCNPFGKSSTLTSI